jgi:microcystin-dependent protein
MDEMLATIKLFAGSYTPTGFMACDGRTLPIRSNEALFSILGNNYGGDSNQTFKLPKLEAPVEHMRWIICVNGLYPVRED